MRYDVLRAFDRDRTPREALARWDAVADSLAPVAQSQNFVYRFRDSAGGENFLRLAHESHRRLEFIAAELDFVNYLAEQGADVAPPVRSLKGELIETVESPGGPFYAAVFRRVHGEPVKWNTDGENRAILFERGKTIGKIHRLSQAYRPAGPRRFHWYEDDLFVNPWEYCPPSQPAVRAEYSRLMQFLLARPRTPENYGMVHGDFGSNNTLRRNGVAVAFDFDDCCFHWFMFDIGVAMQAGIRLPDNYRKAYLRVMLEGYQTEKTLGGDRIEDVAMFCRLSTFFRYLSSLRAINPEQITPEQRDEITRRHSLVEKPPEWFEALSQARRSNHKIIGRAGRKIAKDFALAESYFILGTELGAGLRRR